MTRTKLTCAKPLVVPYQEPVVKGEVTDFSSTMSSTLPMAAMFMRNKFVGWYAIPWGTNSERSREGKNERDIVG